MYHIVVHDRNAISTVKMSSNVIAHFTILSSERHFCSSVLFPYVGRHLRLCMSREHESFLTLTAQSWGLKTECYLFHCLF